jgi:hypothetical protein
MKTIVLSMCALGAATFGAFAQASKVESTTAVTTAEPAKASPEVGLSSRDGITISGADLMMTRNGVTEKVTKVLELENGTRVQPNGTITTAEGAKIVLRPAQILTFDGRLLNISTTAAPATTTTTTTTTNSPATPVVPTTPATEKTTPDAAAAAAAEAARAEAERRARAAEAK